ncbi:MAG: 3-deoxy-manno-octulosonate cytidylyltransferase [Candidatus Omnitrophica bacterium]|nr:3-deoxy-manno-octulosonate cytidylyltransferase [Candidatus Omnitrophota bacterium]
MRIIGIIPARMAATRFPGKPLADIYGRAMIYHVYYRSLMCQKLDEVYIATPDKRIRDYCGKNGMKVVMTKDTHERASDRAAEAMLKIEKRTGKRTGIVVMIQGDEPMVTPEMIGKAVTPLLRSRKTKISCLMGPLKNRSEERDPNLVKVVVDKKGYALYFSREPIPSRKKFKGAVTLYKQVPFIPFTRDFLIRFNELEPTPLEEVESVDMLRVLEHGYRIKMIPINGENQSVDNEKDLRKVIRLMKNDPLMDRYLLP